jgi:hypothetical protein
LDDSVLRDGRSNAKYCPSCMERGIKTPVEKYKAMPMEYCTFHYWLMRGRLGGPKLDEYSLEEYVKVSELHSFVVSLPSDDAMRSMQGQMPTV